MKRILLIIAAVSAFSFAKADPFGDYQDLGIRLSNYDTYTKLEETAQQESITLYRREVSL